MVGRLASCARQRLAGRPPTDKHCQWRHAKALRLMWTASCRQRADSTPGHHLDELAPCAGDRQQNEDPACHQDLRLQYLLAATLPQFPHLAPTLNEKRNANGATSRNVARIQRLHVTCSGGSCLMCSPDTCMDTQLRQRCQLAHPPQRLPPVQSCTRRCQSRGSPPRCTARERQQR